jgi:hypothetical protein
LGLDLRITAQQRAGSCRIPGSPVSIDLSSIRRYLDCGMPAVLATCSAEGTPHIAYAHDVRYIEPNRIAMTFDKSNDSHRDLIDNPVAEAIIVDSTDGIRLRAGLRFLHAETGGRLPDTPHNGTECASSHRGFAPAGCVFEVDFIELTSLEATRNSATLSSQVPVSILDARRTGARAAPAEAQREQPLCIRFFSSNCSIFLDGNYLIKGVAGAIFWKLVCDFEQSGRTEFSNRELRLDPRIGLPAFSDNLEARLVLLKHRLREHGNEIAITPVSRGRFRLEINRPLLLQAMDATAVQAAEVFLTVGQQRPLQRSAVRRQEKTSLAPLPEAGTPAPAPQPGRDCE